MFIICYNNFMDETKHKATTRRHYNKIRAFIFDDDNQGLDDYLTKLEKLEKRKVLHTMIIEDGLHYTPLIIATCKDKGQKNSCCCSVCFWSWAGNAQTITNGSRCAARVHFSGNCR